MAKINTRPTVEPAAEPVQAAQPAAPAAPAVVAKKKKAHK